MGRSKDGQRANRERKIKQRKNLINSICGAWLETTMPFCERMEIKDGYLSNNNEVNRWSHAGCAKKTKARHGHTSYRHKGAYGPAIRRTVHDQRQVDSMNEQEMENDSVWNV